MAININIPSQFREYNNLASFPATGDAKILYVAKNNNKLYRWDTSAYVEVSPQLASSWGSITGNLASQVDLQGALDNKVNTEAGKGLSTNDYTTTEKNKLAGISAGAEVNVNADWNATSGDAEILNKPTIPSIVGLATTSYVDSQDATKQDVLVSGTNVKTVEGQSILGSGNIDLSKSDVGLGNVDNTSDANKPISTATQTALNAKQATLVSGTNIKTINGTTVLGSGDITISGGSGVTDVTATSPLASTGGTTPDISINQATTSSNGYLSSTDWNNFNGKQNALSSGTNIKTINSTSVLESGNIAVQPTLVSGTNIKTVNSTSLLGSGDVSVGVTSVTGTSPITSSGGTTPAISIATANTSTTGALTSTDWNTFNGKQAALVSGTNIKTINGSSVLGSGDLTISGGGGLKGVHNINGYFSETSQGISAQITAGNNANSLLGMNQMRAYPFIPNKSITSVSLKINVSAIIVAGVNCRILIYSDNNGNPNSKLYESANLNCSTTGIKTAITSFTFNAGTTYWLAVHSSNTLQLTGIQPANLMPLLLTSTFTGVPITTFINYSILGSAPATFSIQDTSNGAVPMVGIYLS